MKEILLPRRHSKDHTDIHSIGKIAAESPQWRAKDETLGSRWLPEVPHFIIIGGGASLPTEHCKSIASRSPTMGTLRTSFLGSIAEVCIVTGDHKKTMDGLLRLGIGPFQVFDFTSTTVSERSFRGQAGSFELKVCFAKQGPLTFEIMQPTGGQSLMAEYLDQVSRKASCGRDVADTRLEKRYRRRAAYRLRLQRHSHEGAQEGNARKRIRAGYGRYLEREEGGLQLLFF